MICHAIIGHKIDLFYAFIQEMYLDKDEKVRIFLEISYSTTVFSKFRPEIENAVPINCKNFPVSAIFIKFRNTYTGNESIKQDLAMKL